MSDAKFSVSLQHGLAVVTTPAEIDISNAALLREALVSAAATGLAVIVIDMSGTEYCDSTGLAVLLRALEKAQQAGGDLRLVMGGRGLQRVLTVTGVADMFRIFQTLGQALDAA